MIRFQNRTPLLLLSFGALLFASCAGLGAAKVPENPPERPPAPELLLGKGRVGAEQLAGFLLKNNASAEAGFVRNLAVLYIEECEAEGVNHDVAFSQMCHETGFLRYGGLVTPGMNNFCGLGAIGPEQPGERFPSARIGVRAHVQHLKGYATDAPLRRELVDPRYRWIKYGSAPAIHDLTGRWASDREYGNKLTSMVERLYSYAL
jgi:hypothetical protein